MSEVVPLTMIIDTVTVIHFILIIFAGSVIIYAAGWLFSAGYHQRKYQHTKRLMQLLREGTTQDEPNTPRV